MGLFDNLSIPGGNPFAFLANQDQSAPAAAPSAPPVAPAPAAALAGTALAGAPAASGDGPATPAAPAAPQGLLGRLMATSPDGLTFADKLNAAGSILQGRGDQADKFIADRRTAIAKATDEAQKLKDAAQKQRITAAMGGALARNTRADGTIDVQGYLRDTAAIQQAPDDKVLAAIYAHNIPKPQLATGRNGELDVIDVTHPQAGPLYHRDAGPAAPPAGYRLKGDGSGIELIPGYAEGVQQKAAAERAGKPLAPRVGGQSGYLPPPPGLVRVK